MQSIRMFLVLLVAFVLTIVPFAPIIALFRPSWVLLVLFYVHLYLPRYASIGLFFVIGLYLDVILSSVLGVHVLALLLVSWITASTVRRVSFFSLGQQMLSVFLITVIYQVILMVLDMGVGMAVYWLQAVTSAVSAMLLWPWIRYLLDRFLHANARKRSRYTTNPIV